MDKYEWHKRHRERVHRKWLRLKPKLHRCSCGGAVGLNESLFRRFNRFYCECEECHWTSPKAMTVRGAIRKWNQDYLNAVKDGYMGDNKNV